MDDKIVTLHNLNRCKCGGVIRKTCSPVREYHAVDGGYSGTCISYIKCDTCGCNGKQVEHRNISRSFTDL